MNRVLDQLLDACCWYCCAVGFCCCRGLDATFFFWNCNRRRSNNKKIRTFSDFVWLEQREVPTLASRSVCDLVKVVWYLCCWKKLWRSLLKCRASLLRLALFPSSLFVCRYELLRRTNADTIGLFDGNYFLFDWFFMLPILHVRRRTIIIRKINRHFRWKVAIDGEIPQNKY